MKVPKIWLPETDGCNNKLWDAGNEVIDDYIRKRSAEYVEQHRDKLPPGAHEFDPSKTVRLAILRKNSPQNLLLLPPGLLPEDGGTLKVKAWCEEDINNIPDIPVDIDSWGIIGERKSI
ncbi:hypothetical protein NUU61_004587 [Penicillium alfredii]|uniref:Uncharacterized protein n=1 Tax=Penicillium alfredii TaxID=1506179 RepID=A0A9W9FLY7_9EURO|nr:uncharacterized protein NUU61_004587 [Penicillium alfredii]KAJ5102365.1 hypothetical protein NUU61_004587 [Penicillium alfredii]